MTAESHDKLPSMSSSEDIELMRQLLDKTPNIGCAVELGPWLGALTEHLGSIPELHVVDNFKWTSDHARRVPGLLKPGASFKSAFEKFMAKRNIVPTIYRSWNFSINRFRKSTITKWDLWR